MDSIIENLSDLGVVSPHAVNLKTSGSSGSSIGVLATGGGQPAGVGGGTPIAGNMTGAPSGQLKPVGTNVGSPYLKLTSRDNPLTVQRTTYAVSSQGSRIKIGTGSLVSSASPEPPSGAFAPGGLYGLGDLGASGGKNVVTSRVPAYDQKGKYPEDSLYGLDGLDGFFNDLGKFTKKMVRYTGAAVVSPFVSAGTSRKIFGLTGNESSNFETAAKVTRGVVAAVVTVGGASAITGIGASMLPAWMPTAIPAGTTGLTAGGAAAGAAGAAGYSAAAASAAAGGTGFTTGTYGVAGGSAFLAAPGGGIGAAAVPVIGAGSGALMSTAPTLVSSPLAFLTPGAAAIMSSAPASAPLAAPAAPVIIGETAAGLPIYAAGTAPLTTPAPLAALLAPTGTSVASSVAAGGGSGVLMSTGETIAASSAGQALPAVVSAPTGEIAVASSSSGGVLTAPTSIAGKPFLDTTAGGLLVGAGKAVGTAALTVGTEVLIANALGGKGQGPGGGGGAGPEAYPGSGGGSGGLMVPYGSQSGGGGGGLDESPVSAAASIIQNPIVLGLAVTTVAVLLMKRKKR